MKKPIDLFRSGVGAGWGASVLSVRSGFLGGVFDEFSLALGRSLGDANQGTLHVNNTAKSNAEHKWNSDRPGSLPDHDALSRRGFAQRVAKELRGWRQKDSLVISLNGDWGSGKTTVVNLIRHYAMEQSEEAREAAPIFVPFNPWQWSGQEMLMQAFFDEIGAAFRGNQIKDRNRAKRLADFWEGLKLATVAGGELATRLQESLTALTALLAGASGVLAGRLQNESWSNALSIAGVALLAISAACAIYAPVAEKLAAWFKWKASSPKPTLEAVRKDLKAELEKLPAPIVVVIDDIDRLTKAEVRMVVQLVKANADFPNLVYVLLFQKSIVADALGEITCEAGQEFLKKIVQVELEMPAPPEHNLRKFFEDQISPVLDRAVVRWDKDRWSELFDDVIWPWFSTPRDIKRFRGMLEFYLEAHVEDGALEVNPIDLILLEILRMFDPVAFEAVGQAFQKQRNLFVEILFGDKEAKQRFILGVKKLTEREDLDEDEQRRLRALLLALFPQARENGGDLAGSLQEWDRDLRICHGKHFPRYFQLGGNPGDIGAAFMNKLFRAGPDVAGLQTQLRAAIEAGSFDALLERLRAVREDVPKQMIEPLITAFFNLSDDLPKVSAKGLFSAGAERDLVRLIITLLKQLRNQELQATTLRNATDSSPAVTGPVMSASFLEPKKEEHLTRDDLPVDLNTVRELQQKLLPRIWNVAQSGKIWSLHMSAYLIYRLFEWDRDNAIAWITEAIQEPKAARAFLMSMLRESQVTGSNGSRSIYHVMAVEMEKFVNLETLAVAAQSVMLDELEKAAFSGLKEAIERKKQGKPYAEIYVVSREHDGRLFYDERDRI